MRIVAPRRRHGIISPVSPAFIGSDGGVLLKKEWLVLCLFLAAVFVLTLWTGAAVGNTADEQTYRKAGDMHVRWFALLIDNPKAAFSQQALSAFWLPLNENGGILSNHPPLVAFLIGLSTRVFGAALGPIMASRIVTACFFVLLLGVVYCFVKSRYGIRAALFSVLALLLMPRVFGDAHIAALDLPMAAMAFLATVCFVKGMDSKKWSLLYGLFLGLALLTKINALFLPVPLLLGGLFYNWRKMLPNVLATFVIAPLVFCALWPWMWFGTFDHISEYLMRHFSHTAIGVYYLGKTYFQQTAPWHYPFVLTALTVPFTLLFAAVAGMVAANARKDRRLGPLLVLSALVPLGVAALPWALKYDGVRLFLLVFPFLACLAGIGFDSLCGLRGRRKAVRFAVATALAFALLLSPLISTLKYHPYYLSYYNEIAGGIRGASAMGMEDTYWGDAVNRNVYTYIQDNIKPGPDGEPPVIWYFGLWDAPEAYQNPAEKIHLNDVILEHDLEKVAERTWRLPDYILLNCRKGAFDKTRWDLYRNGENIYFVRVKSFDFDGVPLVMLFKRKPGAPLQVVQENPVAYVPESP